MVLVFLTSSSTGFADDLVLLRALREQKVVRCQKQQKQLLKSRTPKHKHKHTLALESEATLLEPPTLNLCSQSRQHRFMFMNTYTESQNQHGLLLLLGDDAAQ